jgi:hypothetical protein
MASRLVQKIILKILEEPSSSGLFSPITFGRAGPRWPGMVKIGSDGGREIIGNEPIDGQPARRTVIQCINRSKLTQLKAELDLKAAVAACSGSLDAFKLVTRETVSAKHRDAIEWQSNDLVGRRHAVQAKLVSIFEISTSGAHSREHEALLQH